jgi:aminomuconate-semialdehyde/2-hydroxymuconate-6-semialdehyde dehydrogenase
VEAAVRAGFSNQGQICLCGSRVLVERRALEPFLQRFVARVRNLKLGDPLETGTEQGSLVSAQHRDKVLSYIALAKEEGGTILLGGHAAPPPNARCQDGYFVEPTIITGLSPQCRVNMEEIFGPVVTVLPFETRTRPSPSPTPPTTAWRRACGRATSRAPTAWRTASPAGSSG